MRFVLRRVREFDDSNAWFLSLLVPILCLCLLGCAPSPEECHEVAIASEKAAQSAWEAKNPKAARRAFREAERAATILEKAYNNTSGVKEQETLKPQLVEAQTAARNARRFAETAEEEQERLERLGGFKVKAYRKARLVMFETLLPEMTEAAKQAGEEGLDSLSAVERGYAEIGWQLVSLTDLDKAPVKDLEGWARVHNTLGNWKGAPPIEFQLVLACCFSSMGASDLALYELEATDSSTVTNKELRLLHGVGKALLYSLQGWNRLAASEFDKLAKEADEAELPIEGDMIVALVHGFAAYDAMTKNELLRMDAEVAESIRAWPNNPLSVYLTGERLAANGEWEKAAESFESFVDGTKDEWLAERLASRARALRDGKGNTRSFVLDAPLVIQFGIHMLIDKMAESPARTKIDTAMVRVRKSADQLRQKVKLPWTPLDIASSASTNSQGAEPTSERAGSTNAPRKHD